MAIHFLVRTNRKKAPRINVLRYIKDQRGKKSHESLGTLPEDLAMAMEIFNPILDEFEQYQLENYVKNIQFNIANFHVFADETERELIYLAPTFHDALFKLWKLAKENNLGFNPHEVMLTAILNKTKSVERHLKEKLDQPINALEKMGVDLHRFDKNEINKRLHTGSQALFQALLKIGQPLEIITEKFNKLAKNYDKNANLKPSYIQEYSRSPKRLSLWYSAIAIEILLEYGADPLKIVSLEQVINAWLTINKEKMSVREASRVFMETFKITNKKEEISKLISARYDE